MHQEYKEKKKLVPLLVAARRISLFPKTAPLKKKKNPHNPKPGLSLRDYSYKSPLSPAANQALLRQETPKSIHHHHPYTFPPKTSSIPPSAGPTLGLGSTSPTSAPSSSTLSLSISISTQLFFLLITRRGSSC